MTTQVRKNVMDMFIDGARRGFTIATTNLLPNVVMAFVIIQALKITGLLDWVGHICQPVMALWGLPGEAATVLLASLMSMGGAVGVAASLATAGARRRAKRPRCYRTTASHLPDGKPGTECRPLSRYCRSQRQILPAYYRSLRHQCAAVDLGHAAYCLIRSYHA